MSPTSDGEEGKGHLEESQQVRWNGRAGHAWVDQQQMIDTMFQSIADLLVGFAASRSGGAVLDVGCGTGSTTLAAARLPGASPRCVGIDISEPMITVARARAQREDSSASFVLASAQDHEFEPASFDTIFSRFGVMFFEDPVRAFANLHRAAASGAELCVIAWRSAAENPFMTTAERAVAPLLPSLPARQPDGPGQFAFADDRKVRRILEESGWADVDLQPIELACAFPARDLAGYLSRMGPLGPALETVGEQTRAHLVETARKAFEPFVHGDEIRYLAACWKVTARRSSP